MILPIAPEKKELTLSLSEIYQSIQGEASFVGFPTTFIRFFGCNMRCQWCDTTKSYKKEGIEYTLEDVITSIHDYDNKRICITGGEPLLQENVHHLLQHFCDNDIYVTLETSGSLSIADVDPRVRTILDIKCPGSKMDAHNFWGNLNILRKHDEVKFVLADRHDYEYAKNICSSYDLYDKAYEVLLSPAHGILDPKYLSSWILAEKLPVRLNLQIHKYIWSPDTERV